MILEHELLKKQKRRKSISKVKVDLYPLATELFMELDSLGFIQRLKEIPQLGVKRVVRARLFQPLRAQLNQPM